MLPLQCSALLFDLDGVLVDSTAYIEKQWTEWAVSRGLDPYPFLRACHGRRAVETIRIAAPYLDAEAEVAAFQPSEPEEDSGVRAMPGAAQLLAALPEECWAVVTSGRRDLAYDRLEAVGLPLPETLIGANDVDRGKPDPEGYLLAARRLGREPGQCIVVEDAPAGIEAADRAGMRVIGVASTMHRSDLRRATIVVPALTSIQLWEVSESGLFLRAG